MVNASTPDGPATCTCSKTKALTDTTLPSDVLSLSQQVTTKVNAPLPLTEDCKAILLQMQKTYPFCKCISKWLLNGKAPHHTADTFFHISGLFHKHAMYATQKFLLLVISKSWCFTVLIKVHEKLGHQGIKRTYHLIKWQHYWKGMNKDNHKYIANCVLCKGKKAKMQIYPLQMMDISDHLLDKITIDLTTDFSVSTS